MDKLNFSGWQAPKTVEVVEADGTTRVLVKGQVHMSWPSGDEGCLRLAMVQLTQCGLGKQEDLAAAFGRHITSLQRYVADFVDGGMAGLVPERRGPKGAWKLTPELRGKILWIVLKEGVGKLEAIQQRLTEAWPQEVSVPSIQQVLVENGLGEPTAPEGDAAAVQSELFDPLPNKQLWLRFESGSRDRSSSTGSGGREVEKGSGSQPGAAPASDGSGWQREARRSYSRAQRVYLDRLEQGEDNA